MSQRARGKGLKCAYRRNAHQGKSNGCDVEKCPDYNVRWNVKGRNVQLRNVQEWNVQQWNTQGEMFGGEMFRGEMLRGEMLRGGLSGVKYSRTTFSEVKCSGWKFKGEMFGGEMFRDRDEMLSRWTAQGESSVGWYIQEWNVIAWNSTWCLAQITLHPEGWVEKSLYMLCTV